MFNQLKYIAAYVTTPVSAITPNGQTIRTIADVRQERALPEWNRCNERLTETRVSNITHYGIGHFRGATLPEIPSSLLLTCPTHSLLDIRRSD